MENISYTPDINVTQQEQDVQAMQTGMEQPVTQELPEEQFAAGLKTWAARKIIKETATDAQPEKQLSDMLLRYGVDPIRPEEVAQDVTKQIDEPLVAQPKISERKEALNLAKSDIDDFDTTDTYQMNFETIEEPDDVRAVIAAMADGNAMNIDEARRGIVADEQLRGLADSLGGDPEFIRKVLEREEGGMLSPEEMLATRQVLEQSAVKLKEMADTILTPEGNSEMNRAKFARQFHFHNTFQASFMGARAEYGRGMRAIGIPTGSNDQLVAENISAQAVQMNRNINIDNIAASISTAGDVRGITAAVQAADPSSWGKAWDSLYEVFINGILSGASTHIVNTSGSILRVGVDLIDTKVASLMGGFGADDFDKIGGDEYKAKLFAQISGFKEMWKVSWDAMKTGDPYQGLQKADYIDHRAITAENYNVDPESFMGGFIDFSGKVLRAPTERLMGGTDAFMKKMAERGAIAQLAYRRVNALAKEKNWSDEKALDELAKLIKNPTEEMREQALNESLDMTFQTPLGKTGQKIQKNVHEIPGLRWVFPFVKTPVNLLKQAYMERTPIGLISKKYREDIMAGGARGQMARAKMATGTALATTVYMMALDGKITGSDPTDKDVRTARHEAGWRPRSFIIETPRGKEYISYDRFEPFSYMIGAAADIAAYNEVTQYTQLGEDDEAKFDRMADAVILSFAENTLNKTFMTGMRDMMNVWTDPGRYGSRYLKNQLNAMTPFSGARKNIKRTIDDEVKGSDTIGEYLQDQWNVLGSDMPTTVDSFGKEVKYDRVLSPWTYKEETRSKARREVARLAETTKMAAVPNMSRKVSGVELTNKEYVKIKVYSRKEQVIGGKTFIQAITERINAPEYNELIDDHKVEQLRRITLKYDEAAKNHARATDKKLLNRVMNKDLIMPAKYISKMQGISEEQAYEELKQKYNK